jgi:hypothetical protein
MFGREFDCEHVSVEEIGGGRYSASGCDRTVVYQCIGQTCIVDGAASELEEDSVARSRPAPAPVADSTVQTRTAKSKSGKTVVSADIRLDNRSLLKLRAAATEQAGVVQLKLVRSEPEQELEGCNLDLMINGQRVDTPKPKFSRDMFVSGLRTQIPRELMRELGVAQRFAIRACEHRWSLRPEQLEELRGFVESYEEELAWEGPARKGGSGGLVAPSGGWPEWKVVGATPAPVTAGPALDAEALFKLLAPSIVQVEAFSTRGTSQGSAVAVSKTELLTNCHVVQAAQKVILKQKKWQAVAELARADPATDRCVLEVESGNLTPVRGVRAYEDLAVGEPAYTLGSPSGLQLSLANGIVSGLREVEGRSFVQTTAPISPGSSGGGLFDARGNVIGITTLVLQGRERLNQSLNFAIPAASFWKP